jgi:hypothetical protein
MHKKLQNEQTENGFLMHSATNPAMPLLHPPIVWKMHGKGRVVTFLYDMRVKKP